MGHTIHDVLKNVVTYYIKKNGIKWFCGYYFKLLPFLKTWHII
jgi:hypothetical protein